MRQITKKLLALDRKQRMQVESFLKRSVNIFEGNLLGWNKKRPPYRLFQPTNLTTCHWSLCKNHYRFVLKYIFFVVALENVGKFKSQGFLEKRAKLILKRFNMLVIHKKIAVLCDVFYSPEPLKTFSAIYKKKLSKVKYIIICSIHFCCVPSRTNLNCYYFSNGIKWFWL